MELPVIAEGVGHLEKELEIPMKEIRLTEEVSASDYIQFWDTKLDKRLVGIESVNEETYSLKEREGMLRLYNRKERIAEKSNCAYLGVRQKSYQFYAETGVEFEPVKEKETAGMVLYQNHANHLRMEIKRRNGKKCFAVTTCIQGKEKIISEVQMDDEKKFAKIRIQCDRQKACVWIQTGEEWIECAKEISLLPYTTEEAGGFVGCTIGMYASANGAESSNHADFGWFVQNAV